MIVGTKAALTEEQLLDRREKGATWFEVHTNYEDIENLETTIEKKSVLKEIGLKTYCVHAPMYDENKNWLSFVATDEKLQKKSFDSFKKTVMIANEICHYEKPLVVAHIDLLIYMSEFDNKEKFKDYHKRAITEMNEFLIKNYPNVTLLIENFPKITKRKEITIIPNDYTGELKECFDELKPTNIGFLIDTCHLEASCNINKMIPNKQTYTSIHEIIYLFKDYLKQIHLSKAKYFGLRSHEHGAGFNKKSQDDMAYMKEFLLFLNLIGYKNPITIETYEENISDAINYKMTRETIEEANRQLNNIFDFEF